MALLISGQITHRHMAPEDVEAALKRHIPGLVVGPPDFSVERNLCRAEFFRNTTSTLDFNVVMVNSTPPHAALALLSREAETLSAALVGALSRRLRKAELQYCRLEDQRSRSPILIWTKDSPLTSRAAKLSYGICLILLILGGVFVRDLLEQPPSVDRDYDVLSLVLAIGLPALTLPLPFVFEYVRGRGSGRWIFGNPGGST